jgi:hypothetical protein
MILSVQAAYLYSNFRCSRQASERGVATNAGISTVSSKRKKSHEENSCRITSNSSKHEEVGENE